MSSVEHPFQALVVQPGDESLSAWMRLSGTGTGDFGAIGRDDLEQRFSLGPYIQMVKNGITTGELTSILREDARAYIEEYVLKMKIGIKEFSLREGDLYSDKYGEASFLTMCRNTMVARQQQGLDIERARHEGLGVANIVKLLEVANVGQVVMLISPPYERETYGDDKPYSMLYLYQKQENGKIWFGAVRDDVRSIDDWQNFARDESMWQTDWGGYDDLKFVALPMVATKNLRELMDGLGISGVEQIPNWMEREARLSAQMLANNLVSGNNSLARRILDAFKLVVVGGRNQMDSNSEGYSVAQTALDYRYGWLVHQMFLSNGGEQVLAAGGLCGGDSLATQWGSLGDLFNQPTLLNNTISGAMGIDESRVTTTNSDGKPEGIKKTLYCVHCPLCGRDGVDAYITATHIHCSKCKGSKALSNP